MSFKGRLSLCQVKCNTFFKMNSVQLYVNKLFQSSIKYDKEIVSISKLEGEEFVCYYSHPLDSGKI